MNDPDDVWDDETDLEPEEADEEQQYADRIAAARQLIADHQSQQEQQCLEEVRAVLEKYGMRMTVTPAQIVLGPAGD